MDDIFAIQRINVSTCPLGAVNGRVLFFSKKEKTFDFSKVFILVEVTGFEPATFWSRTKRATKLRYTSKYGANEGTRTLDLRFTKPLLYRLSHIGV